MKPYRTLLLLLISSLLLAGCGNVEQDGAKRGAFTDTAIYDFRDTRKLVSTVKNASLLVERKGNEAFSEFKNAPKTWNNDLYYVYVYSIDGSCLYHPQRPDFEGRNLIDVTDVQGRRTLQMAIQATGDPNNPHGWIHYVWHSSHGLQARAKSSCHFRVTMPDGREVIVGGGMDMPSEEKMFAKFTVDSAVEMLKKQGACGLDEIRNPTARFRYRDVKVFVLQEDGTALIDPALDTVSPRNLKDYRDIGGNYPFRSVIERLRREDSCWVVALDRNRYARVMGKKVIYARKGMIDSVPVVVGAMTSLPKPVWSN
jgi:hypothetical protein